MGNDNKINGFDLEGYKEGLAVARERAGASRAPKSCRIEWVRGVKFKATIRQHTFTLDEPRRLGGEDEYPNSMEYILGAYGACLAGGFVINASTKGIEIHEIDVSLESTQKNAFTFLGLASDGHPGFDHIEAKLKVRAEADEATIRELWDYTVSTSPVHATLAESVELHAELETSE